MKVVNLDKFKKVQKVVLDGVEYDVKGVTVDMYLNDAGLSEANTEGEAKEKIRYMVDTLVKLSTIPKDTLLAQPVEILTAILMVAQGIDPEKQLAAQEGSEPEKK